MVPDVLPPPAARHLPVALHGLAEDTDDLWDRRSAGLSKASAFQASRGKILTNQVIFLSKQIIKPGTLSK